jgi:predicted dehydrogenase/threonine dehydrogenase-like Zn-dependent dehydrogenase
MKKLVINHNGQVILQEAREPIIETSGVIVRTSFALISSGTELSTIKWNRLMNLPIYKQFLKSKYIRQRIFAELKHNTIKNLFKLFRIYKEKSSYKNYPRKTDNLTPIGYSCSGIVEASNIENLQVNDRVACAGSFHAEKIFSPKNLTVKIPDNVSLEEAAFATLGAIALHGIHRANIKPGENVGIIGTGLIGLIAVELAKLSGAKVFAFDLINNRLNLAKKLGADILINPRNYNSKLVVDKQTNSMGLDSIIICASSNTNKPLEDAVELIRDKGKIVMLGAFPVNIDRNKIYYKEPDLLISRSYGPGRYDPYYEYEGFDYPKNFVPWTEQRNMEYFLKLISENKIDVKSLITDIILAEKADDAYKKLEMDAINNIAILLKFVEEDPQLVIPQKEKLSHPKQKKLVIGLIGCGSFAQGTHLPLILSNPYCKIKAISTNSQKTADLCKQKYKTEYTTTNYKKILKDPEIDTVFIYTRHDTHANFAIEAIKSGKNVFVEKPMGLTLKECQSVYEIVKKSNKNYFIGFNRRFSPFITITKELLHNTSNPIIINYRISSQFIPGSHWVFNPKVGGGPIIGEFCHFIDLVLYLTNSNPIEVIARGGAMSHKNTQVFDSCVVILKFENGSIANLIYTDLNGPKMSKERIEIYSGDSAIIIDDFLKFNTSGFDFGNLLLNEQDKGHKDEVENIIHSNLGSKDALVSVDDALKSMEIVFKVIKSIKTNEAIQIDY